MIEIDYTPFGVVGVALVEDDQTPFPWYETVRMLGYECDSDWHEEESCDCVSEDVLREIYMSNIASRGIRLVTEEEENE